MAAQNFGALATTGARLVLKVALQTAANDRMVVVHVATRLYRDETGKNDWPRLSSTDRAIWEVRARSAIDALLETVGGGMPLP